MDVLTTMRCDYVMQLVYRSADIFIVLNALNLFIFALIFSFVNMRTKFLPAYKCLSIFLVMQSFLTYLLAVNIYNIAWNYSGAKLFVNLLTFSLIFLYTFSKKSMDIANNVPSKLTVFLPVILLYLGSLLISNDTLALAIKTGIGVFCLFLGVKTLFRLGKLKGVKRHNYYLTGIWLVLHVILFVLFFVLSCYQASHELNAGILNSAVAVCFLHFLLTFCVMSYFPVMYAQENKIMRRIKLAKKSILDYVFIVSLATVELLGVFLVIYVTNTASMQLKNNLINQAKLAAVSLESINWKEVKNTRADKANNLYKSMVFVTDKISKVSPDFSSLDIYIDHGSGFIEEYKSKNDEFFLVDSDSEIYNYLLKTFNLAESVSRWPYVDKNKVNFSVFVPIKNKSDDHISIKAVLSLSLDNVDGHWFSLIVQRRTLSFALVTLLALFCTLIFIVKQRLDEKAQIINESRESLLSAQKMAQLVNFEYDVRDNSFVSTDTFFEMHEIDKNVENPFEAFLKVISKEEDAAALRSKFIETLSKNIFNELEYKIKTASGKIKYFNAKIAPKINSDNQRTVIIGTIQDVTAQKHSEEFFKSVFYKNKTIMVVVDVNTLEIVDFNKSAMNFYGYSKKDLLKKTLRDIDTSDEKTIINKIAFAEKMQYANIQIKNRLASGEIRDMDAYTSALEMGNKRVLFCILFDITEKNLATEAVVKAKEDAEHANKSKSMFLANMSHEIRTPMNAVLGYSQLVLNSDKLDNETRERVQTIQKSGDHLLGIINNILEMSKIEAGHAKILNSFIDVKEFFEDIKKMFAVRMLEKNLFFNLEFKNIPKAIEIDEDKLRQVVINLLGNSLKFTQEGGITCEIIFEDGKSNKIPFLLFKVIDTGVGISQEELATIFQTFEQSDAGRVFGGTGLGLSITYSLVHLLGGKITVESQLGKGTIFTVKLPVKEFGNLKVESKIDTRKVLSLANPSKEYLFLVVDDSYENRVILSAILKSVGFNVIEAIDGFDAIEKAKSNTFDCIFMDVRMPKLDGIGATKEIRLLEKYRQTPIVAVTASAFAEEKEKIFAAGLSGYIIKPYKESMIFSTLKEQLNLEYNYKEEAVLIANTDKKAAIYEAALKNFPIDIIIKINNSIAKADLDDILIILEENAQIIPPDFTEYVKKLVQNYQYDLLQKLFRIEQEIK